VPWCDGHSRKGVTRLDAFVALARRWAPPSLERKSSQCTSKLLPARQPQPSIRLLDQGWQGPFKQWPGGRLQVRKCLQERDICEWRLRLGAASIGTNCMQSMPIAGKQAPGQERKPHRLPQTRPLTPNPYCCFEISLTPGRSSGYLSPEILRIAYDLSA
jgi:hypothetical protein